MRTLRDAVATILAFLPALVAGLIVLAIAWIIAVALRRLINALLPRTGLDRFLARHSVIERADDTHAGSRVVASATYWAILLIGFMQAANIWDLEFVARGLRRTLAYIPNLVAAVLVFGVALFLGNWTRERMRTHRTEEEATTTFLPDAVRAAILTVGAFIALRQLMIAPEILLIAFAVVLGGIALATAIAVGLGGRHTVERMTQDWYEQRRSQRRGGPGAPTMPGPGAGPAGVPYERTT